MPLLETLDFICRVERYPALWRKEDRDFSNRDVRKKLFEFISSETGIPVDKCKTKLKGLKDRMREICHRLPRTKSGGPAFHAGERLVNWAFFKPLLFMADQFVAPRPKENHPYMYVSETYGAEDEDEEENEYDDVVGEVIEYECNDNVDQDSNDTIPQGNGAGIMDSPVGVNQEIKVESALTPQPSSSTTPSSSSARGMKRNSSVPTTKTKAARNNCHSDASYDDNSPYQNMSPQSTHNVYPQSTHNVYPQSTHNVYQYNRPSQGREAYTMWDAFAADITNDLRLVNDPLLQIETKAKIRRIVEQAVHEQLTEKVKSDKGHSDRNSYGTLASTTTVFVGNSPSHPSG